MNNKLGQEILFFAEKDQKMRRSGKWDPNVDKKNTRELKNIIKTYGWPDIDMVGKKASRCAWLIAQHADHDVRFQEYCLKLLEKKMQSGKIEAKYIPYLTDRVLVNLGKSQLYGTQFYLNKFNKLVPRPIKNVRELAQRRRKFKLESFAKYKNRLQKVQKLFIKNN